MALSTKLPTDPPRTADVSSRWGRAGHGYRSAAVAQRPADSLPPDHPDRESLADEVHARPPEPIDTPSSASYVAVLIDPAERANELSHLNALCSRHGVSGPSDGATHFSAALGALRLKWERHGEFSGYTFVASARFAPLASLPLASLPLASLPLGSLAPVSPLAPFQRSPMGASAEPNPPPASSDPHAAAHADTRCTEPFDEPATSKLPAGWLHAIPGLTVTAVHAELMPAGEAPPDAAALTGHFEGQPAIGAEIGDGAAFAFTDFRIHGDGFTRFVVLDRSLSPRQAGRILQRLFEIEAYRMLALLALPIARRQSPRIVAIEKSLAALTDNIAGETTPGHDADDEALLQQLTRLAAEVESGLTASQFRFGACRAYHELVARRIDELRETRLPGLQTLDEFMARRFAPAVATCATVSQRLHDLSERVAQASALLSTRVEITRERQNQSLLGSMDRRAKLQLRLQQTVEGLSVAAIVYYVAGLAGYGAKALKAAGLRVDPDIVVGASVPVVAVLVMWAVRRARRQIEMDEHRS